MQILTSIIILKTNKKFSSKHLFINYDNLSLL